MLELISYFNYVLALTISAAYFYQLVYLMYGLVSLRKPWIFVAQKQHRYAVMISARNEEEVIGELIGSLTSQNYPRELLDIYVVADNCTDDTAGAARRRHGAWRRFCAGSGGHSQIPCPRDAPGPSPR